MAQEPAPFITVFIPFLRPMVNPASRLVLTSMVGAALLSMCGAESQSRDTVDVRFFSGIPACKGGPTTAITASVPREILYLQSGHGQARAGRNCMHLQYPIGFSILPAPLACKSPMEYRSTPDLAAHRAISGLDISHTHEWAPITHPGAPDADTRRSVITLQGSSQL
jgi:hypothetical protein